MPIRVLPLLLALLVAACDAGGLLGPVAEPTPGVSASPSPGASGSPAPAGSPSAAPSATPDPRLPAEAATIEGEVQSTEPVPAGSLHVARIKVSNADGTDQAVATVLAGTAIWRQDAKGELTRGAAADLRVGLRVRVWAGGPIRESFPVQFDAKAVLILAGS
jgi:hypothetical protein